MAPKSVPSVPELVIDDESIALLRRRFDFVLDGQHALMIVSVLQLACRKPDFTGPIREFAESFARQVGDALGQTATLKFLIERGWDPTYDVPTEDTKIVK